MYAVGVSKPGVVTVVSLGIKGKLFYSLRLYTYSLLKVVISGNELLMILKNCGVSLTVLVLVMASMSLLIVPRKVDLLTLITKERSAFFC